MKRFLVFLCLCVLCCGFCNMHINTTYGNRSTKRKRREIESREVLNAYVRWCSATQI